MYGPEGNSYFCFPESPDLSRDEVLYCIFKLSLKQPNGKNMLLYSARRQQLHVTKNQPITVLVLLSESLGI